MTVAILYICTGRYSVFWDNFYKSTEKYFLSNHKKEYFVFTDQEISPINNKVHIIYQKKLGWPYDTLLRFHMFYEISELLAKFNYIFFLNANMQCLVPITDEILPQKEGLMAVLHPGFFNKSRMQFTYETNPDSLACIHSEEGEHYFMGGFNGGKSKNYLDLIYLLASNIEKDLEKGIIAIWHDESHLNRYLVDKPTKVLNPSYGYAEGWELPFEPQIIILDKNKYGGHEFLRES